MLSAKPDHPADVDSDRARAGISHPLDSVGGRPLLSGHNDWIHGRVLQHAPSITKSRTPVSFLAGALDFFSSRFFALAHLICCRLAQLSGIRQTRWSCLSS